MASVRMLTNVHAGALGMLATGQTVDVSDEFGAELVGSGRAVWVSAPVFPGTGSGPVRGNYSVTTGALESFALPGGGVQGVAYTHVVRASPGVDCAARVAAGLADLRARGGGVLHFPAIGGGGYATSARIYVDFDNCVIFLEDDLTFNVTTPPSAVDVTQQGMIHFRGVLSGAPRYLEGCALIGSRMVKIDLNGRNIAGYTHQMGNPAAGIQLTGTRNFRMRNIYAFNSLAFGIALGYSPGLIGENLDASDTVHENGIQVDNNSEHFGAVSATNPATWSNARLVNCRAWNCRNHGIGTWGGVGVTLISPKVWNCGNNDGASVAGPAGGINWEFSPTAGHAGATFDFHGTVIDPMVYGSFGFGIRTNCIGVKIIGGRITDTKIPTAYTDSTPPIWGSAIFVQNTGTLEAHGTIISGSERYGVRVTGGASLLPRFYGYGLRISNVADRGVYAIGAQELLIAPDCVFTNCGTGVAGGAAVVDLNNQPANADAGNFYISGVYNNNGASVVRAVRLGFLRVASITGDGNFASAVAPDHAIYVDGTATRLEARDIKLTRSPVGNQARVLRVNGTIADATFVRDSIQGDQSSANPRADITATVMRGDVVSSAAPAGAPLYIGQKWYDTTANKMYFARATGSAADWIILN